MSGETNLAILLKNMRPYLNKGEYVFCCLGKQQIDIEHILFYFKEKEGMTIVCTKAYAQEKSYEFSTIFAWITLDVHSSLEAVGLTAAFSNALAEHHISCNVVAGFYHDHIFVEQHKAAQALAVLEEIGK